MTVLRSETAKAPALDGAGRWARPLAVGTTALVVVIGMVIWALRFEAFAVRGQVGVDYDTFVIFAQRFLETGSMYFPYQLEGPYVLQPPPYTADIMPAIYPPHAIYLFAPFLVLPSISWWAIPLGITAYVVASYRPAPWSWPVIATLVALPASASAVIVGSTTLWMMAFIAAGLRWHWPAVLVTLKPSLLPFALIGIRHRSWWVTATILGLVSLPMLPLYVDYVVAVRNGGPSLLYSLGSVPVLLIPVVASLAGVEGRWLSGRWSRRRSRGPAGQPSLP